MLELMTKVARRLGGEGWTLRSGGAPGADMAFADGAVEAEVYLPWPGFNGVQDARLERPTEAAIEMAARFHPNWYSLKGSARMLHARNLHQVLGPDVENPVLSTFVICWTKDSMGGGGTGTAIRVAQHYDVPVLDLALPLYRARAQAYTRT